MISRHEAGFCQEDTPIFRSPGTFFASILGFHDFQVTRIKEAECLDALLEALSLSALMLSDVLTGSGLGEFPEMSLHSTAIEV